MTVRHARTEDIPRQRRRRGLAFMSAATMTLGGLGMVNATPASAETRTATGGSFQWGIKESLINYHIRHSGSTQTLVHGEGATPSSTTRTVGALGTSPAQQVPVFWDFPFVSGSYDSTTNSYTAQYGGSVTLSESNPGFGGGPTGVSPFKNFEVSNPKVVIDLDSNTKKVVLDVDPGDDGDPSTPVRAPSDDADFAEFSGLTAEATESGGAVTYTALAAVLTAAGSSSFGGFYGAGDPVDPVTTSLTGVGAPPPPPGADLAPPLTQTVRVTLGNTNRFTMTIAGNAPVILAATGSGGGGFQDYTGSLNAITVADTRTSGTWAVAGQVSDFAGTAGPVPGYRLGWTPAVASSGAGAAPGAPVPPGTASGAGLSASRPLASGTANQADPNADLDADLLLRVPDGAAAGDREATITVTATGT